MPAHAGPEVVHAAPFAGEPEPLPVAGEPEPLPVAGEPEPLPVAGEPEPTGAAEAHIPLVHENPVTQLSLDVQDAPAGRLQMFVESQV